MGACWAPSEAEGGSPLEVVVCSPSEEMRGVRQYLEEGVVGGWVVFGQHVTVSVRLVIRI